MVLVHTSKNKPIYKKSPHCFLTHRNELDTWREEFKVVVYTYLHFILTEKCQACNAIDFSTFIVDFQLAKCSRIFYFAKYQFLFRKVQIFHFAKYRFSHFAKYIFFHFVPFRFISFHFVSFRFVPFRFVPFRFAEYSKSKSYRSFNNSVGLIRITSSANF